MGNCGGVVNSDKMVRSRLLMSIFFILGTLWDVFYSHLDGAGADGPGAGTGADISKIGFNGEVSGNNNVITIRPVIIYLILAGPWGWFYSHLGGGDAGSNAGDLDITKANDLSLTEKGSGTTTTALPI
jgi:hypothetical protein